MTTMREGSAFPDLGGVTAEPETIHVQPDASESQPPVVLVGRLVSLRFVLGALRRRRKIWLSCAALGLVVGLGYHLVVPRTYNARATLYLAQAPGSDPSVGMANDIALLQTPAVGQRAADLLGEPSLSPSKLLGKAPGVAASDNILTLNVSGPSKVEAERRASALAKAFLGFRSQRASATNRRCQQGTRRSDQFLGAPDKPVERCYQRRRFLVAGRPADYPCRRAVVRHD